MGHPYGGLGRRLTALEQITEEVRSRPIRRMAEDIGHAHRLGTAETENLVAVAITTADRCVAEIEALRAGGKSEPEIVSIFAARFGVTTEELEAEAARLDEQYGRYI